MVSADDAKRIRAIFLHDGRAVPFTRAARLLGWSSAKMIAAIEAGSVKVTRRAAGPFVTRSELLGLAVKQWPFSVIEEALGPAAESRLPPDLRMRPLPFSVHQYVADMLAYIAAERGTSVETLLAEILDAFSVKHIWDLAENVPSYRDSLPNLTEAKYKCVFDAVAAMGGRETMASFGGTFAI
jgi:hypothetical protein